MKQSKQHAYMLILDWTKSSISEVQDDIHIILQVIRNSNVTFGRNQKYKYITLCYPEMNYLPVRTDASKTKLYMVTNDFRLSSLMKMQWGTNFIAALLESQKCSKNCFDTTYWWYAADIQVARIYFSIILNSHYIVLR